MQKDYFIPAKGEAFLKKELESEPLVSCVDEDLCSGCGTCISVCTYNATVDFEWDRDKAASNLKKHRIDFADAVTVFDDINSITIDDPDHDELRFITIGMDAYGGILVVVYTWRGENIRIISARKATKHEQKYYGSNL